MPSHSRWSWLCVASVLCLSALPTGAAVIYVNANLDAGANNGSSWANAYQGEQALATALAAASSGDEIWVASGRYLPGVSRGSSFVLKNGVGVYGGFAGGETALGQRNLAANICTLTGDLNNDDAPYPSNSGWDDNCLHVVTGTGRDQTAVLDGFTVTHAFANGSMTGDNDRGGGVICASGNATFRNLRIVENKVSLAGAGAYINGASPTFTDCVFQSNAPSSGGSFGGGCAVTFTGNPVFERCRFIANSARRGGAVDIFGNCNVTFINCLVAANTANGSVGGGGISNFSNNGVLNLINCTIAGNSISPGNGGGVYTTSGGPVNVRNCIAYLNTGPGGATTGQQLFGPTYQATYSCVQGGYTGMGNIAANPMLMNPSGGDFHPDHSSPVIDAARNSDYTSPNRIDLDAAPRFVDYPFTPDTGLGSPPIIDMGAFERPFSFTCPTITEQPQSAQICRGADYTLSVEIDAVAHGHQWYKNEVQIPGATQSSYTITEATNADEGAYTVVVYVGFCPFLLSQPALVVVCDTDADCNGVINSTDVSEFINTWFGDQSKGTLLADFDENGVVNSTDVSEFINAWFEESAHGCAG